MESGLSLPRGAAGGRSRETTVLPHGFEQDPAASGVRRREVTDLRAGDKSPPAEEARVWAMVDSNHRPPPYQSGALTD